MAHRKRKSLSGRTIAVTRADGRADELSRRLVELGAEVVETPAIEIRPVRRPRLESAEILLFTSANGVECWFRRMRELGRDARTLADCMIAAVGPATAATLERYGILADFVASEFTSERMARELAPRVRGRTVLHAGADKTNPEVRRILEAHGAKFRKLTLYRIVRPKRIRWPGADLVTFASAQTARNFAALVRERPPAACPGPVTARAARRAGFRVVTEAECYTIEGLVEAILQWAK